MNLDYCRVFYHVYRCGGIRPGARAIRLSQPTASYQMKMWEEQLGAPLFTRKPFAPTPLADELFPVVAALIERVAALEKRSRDHRGPLLRIGAPEFVLQEYLLSLLALIQEGYPSLRITLQAGNSEQLESRLRERELDLAIITVDEPPAGLAWQPLVELPVVLLVPAAHRIIDSDTFWACPPVNDRLITPPACEGVCRRFSAALAARQIHWHVNTATSSTALVPWALSTPDAIGLCVGASSLMSRPGIRAVPLTGVAPVTVGALWQGAPTPALRSLLELIGKGAQKVVAAQAAAKTAVATVAPAKTEKPKPGRRPTSGPNRDGSKPRPRPK